MSTTSRLPTVSWYCAGRPLDQLVKASECCGVSVPTLTWLPTTASNVAGDNRRDSPKITGRPGGSVRSVTETSRGRTSRETLADRPPLSVAVSVTTRKLSAPCSGATTLPPAPLADVRGCVWQTPPGQ